MEALDCQVYERAELQFKVLLAALDAQQLTVIELAATREPRLERTRRYGAWQTRGTQRLDLAKRGRSVVSERGAETLARGLARSFVERNEAARTLR